MNNSNPIPLPLKLRKNGFNYAQVLRGERSFVYSQEVTSDCYYYEVFLKKIAPEKNIKGKIIEARERFPHDEAFGIWAWSYSSYERAYEAFNILEAGKSNPH